MLSLELNTFDPTYFNIIVIAFKMYQKGARIPTLKVFAP